MTSLIYETDRQLNKIIAEIARSLDPNFGLKEFCLECDPSHNGERYYKQGRLSQLCLECVTSSFQERDAFDMAGTYIVQEEANYFSDRLKQCVICKRYLHTHLLTFEGLQMCLLSPEYSHCPYPYLYLKNTQLMFWRTLVICRSARYWVHVLLDLSEPSPFIDHIKAFAE